MPSPELFQAVEAGDAARAAALLRAGADPNAPREDGWTPLMAAAGRGNPEVARALLDGGADPDRLLVTRGDYEDDYGSGPFKVTFEEFLHPLDTAFKHGHETVAALLAERCSDPWLHVRKPPRDPYHDVRTRPDPLLVAAQRGWATVVDRLLDHPAKPPGADEAVVETALADGKAVELRRGAVLEALGRHALPLKGHRRKEALLAGIALGHAGAVRALSRDLSGLDAMTLTQILDAAVASGRAELVEALLPADAWLTARDVIAADRQRYGISLLLAAGPEPGDAPTRRLAWQFAARGGHVHALRRLSAGKATRAELEDALRFAIEGRSAECVRFLLEEGAVPSDRDVHEADRCGEDPQVFGALLLHAAGRGCDPVVSLLLHRREPLNADAALRRAAMSGRESTVDLILRNHGLRAVLSGTAVPEALRAAREAGHAGVVARLQEAGGRPD